MAFLHKLWCTMCLHHINEFFRVYFTTWVHNVLIEKQTISFMSFRVLNQDCGWIVQFLFYLSVLWIVRPHLAMITNSSWDIILKMKVILLESCAATNHSNFLKNVGLKMCFSLWKCKLHINAPTSKCTYNK